MEKLIAGILVLVGVVVMFLLAVAIYGGTIYLAYNYLFLYLFPTYTAITYVQACVVGVLISLVKQTLAGKSVVNVKVAK